MVDEGHIVGNHTVNHVSLPTVSDEKSVDEINRVAQMYAEITNQKMKNTLGHLAANSVKGHYV